MNDIIKYFFEAYFHQDWRYEYSSSRELLEDFIRMESESTVHDLAGAFKELMECPDVLQDRVNECDGNFNPESEEMSAIEWISMALTILQRNTRSDISG
ncbi:contact-dependent growth inhibition system immunity protein [Photobacterium sp. SP02]|uniref:contact-dependent growth inhibition system immunity protein n=1 Tax=Photobacterium sp. SP02 TaxID=3032280 RepID=UPI003145699C